MRLVRLFTLVLLSLAPTISSAGENFYIAVGAGGHRMFSRDGLAWENHFELGPAGHDQNDLNVVTSFKGTIVIGGGYSSGRLMATRDGKTWSDGVLPEGKISARRSSPIFGIEVIHDTLYLMTLHGQVYATSDMENYEEVAWVRMPQTFEGERKPRWVRQAVQGNDLMLGSGDFGPALIFNSKFPSDAMYTQMAGQDDRKQPQYRRVAFGNGIFLVGGQNGLIARSRDGRIWENNVTVPERGDVYSVVWAGDHFLAQTQNLGALVSPDGANWTRQEAAVPRHIIRVHDLLFGWNRRTDFSRSRDGVTWERAKNDKNFTILSIGYGELAGAGDPPNLPGPPTREKKAE